MGHHFLPGLTRWVRVLVADLPKAGRSLRSSFYILSLKLLNGPIFFLKVCLFTPLLLIFPRNPFSFLGATLLGGCTYKWGRFLTPLLEGCPRGGQFILLDPAGVFFISSLRFAILHPRGESPGGGYPLLWCGTLILLCFVCFVFLLIRTRGAYLFFKGG